MNHHFAALVGQLTDILRERPEAQLSCEQEVSLHEIRLDYQKMRERFAQKLKREDPLVEGYLRCFDLSLGCLYLLPRVFEATPGGEARATYLAAFSLQVEELDALLWRLEAATAVRFAEGYLQG